MSATPEAARHRIAVIGGTGAEGSGLAYRWARTGHEVMIGSRDGAKAAQAARELDALLGRAQVRGGASLDVVDAADIVVLTVPYAAQRATALALRTALAGKILVDVTVPLAPPRVGTVQLPAGGSACGALQAELGADVRVVSAFQNVSAHHLKDPDHAIDCDVLVCGDDVQARETVIGLARDAGLRGLHGGPLANSAAAEAMTSLLITINRHYKVPGAGIRITGLPDAG